MGFRDVESMDIYQNCTFAILCLFCQDAADRKLFTQHSKLCLLDTNQQVQLKDMMFEKPEQALLSSYL